MSLNQTMNISLGSMKNNQYALTVVSQNIANMHVEGYHKQRVNFVTNEYTTNCENVISTIKGMNGASISSLSDYIDDGAFNDMIGAKSDAQYYNTLTDALGGLEDIADDLGDNGLNALLNDFYAAAANLEQFPTDVTVREQYISAAQNVCDKFNLISKKYDDVKNDTNDNVKTQVDTVNSLLSNLAEANVAHVKNNCGTSTKAEINSILEELSNYIDVNTDTSPNGMVNVYIGDTVVVKGGDLKFTLESSFDKNDPNKALQFSLISTADENCVVEGVEDVIKSGSLKAELDFLNGSGNGFSNVNDMQSLLNQAASAFASALNEIQTYDNGDVFAASLTSKDGNLILEKATTPFFATSDGSTTFSASNITVNSAIKDNPLLISASRIDLNDFKDEDGNIDPNWVNAIGNSDNATEISALQNKKICAGGTQTLSAFLRNNAAKTGLDLAGITNKADTYQDIYDTDANNYANLIGVNLDEELADMIRYQRAFEASARVFSTVNDLMGTIINMI